MASAQDLDFEERLGMPAGPEESPAVPIAFSPEARIATGLSQQEAGDWRAALQSFGEAARLDPMRASTYLAMGNAHGRLGEWAEAVENYQDATRIDPRYADAFNNLGLALLEIGRQSEAIAAFAKALEINPNHANASLNLAKVLASLDQFEIAFELLERALALEPLHAYAHLELGFVQEKSGLLERAAASYRRSMELDSNRSAREHLAAVLTHMGDPTGVGKLEDLVREEPLSAEAHWNLGMGLLRHGRHEEGWREFEWRIEIPRLRKRHQRLGKTRWQGEPLEGKTILLYGEQGHGDTLQFLRYVPLVAERGGRVILEAPPLLCRLLQGFPGVAECVALGEAKQHFSVYASLMSLPCVLGSGAIPPPLAPADYARGQPRLLRPSKWKVGLVWAGSPTHKGDRLRSLALGDLLPLRSVRSAEFVSLQMGPAAAQARGADSVFELPEPCAEAVDFADTARVIAGLDLVITVDTAVAHLAGTMGKPVWILLSNAPDWRWGLHGTSTDWYPSARLFRQTAPGGWREVLTGVVQELRREIER
jgi:tetratricopeptide (TPR) repeat protein